MKQLFDEIKHHSRSRQIVDKFRQAIAEGTLKVGDKLPPERELCVQLGVSRTALREAVRIMEAYGILEPTQGGGTFVTDRFSENVFEFLGFGDNLNSTNMLQLLRTRMVMESGAIEFVIDTATDSEIDQLGKLVEDLKAETDFDKMGDLDASFHKNIIKLTHNPILTALYNMIWKMLSHATSQVIAYPSAKDVAANDHEKIYLAVKKRNKNKSKLLLIKHFENTERLLEDYRDS